MFCGNCGNRIIEGKIFYVYCGTKVSSVAPDIVGTPPKNQTIAATLTERFRKNSPPPISGIRVNNTLAWAMAVVPLLGSIIEVSLSGLNYLPLWTYWIINSLLAYIDEKNLAKAGYDTSKFNAKLWLILVPVYLYQRAKHLKHSNAYFIVNVVSLVFAVIINE